MHVLEALDRYLLQLQADGRSPHTIVQYQRHVRMLDTWLAAEGHAGDAEGVTPDDLAGFLASDTVRTTAAGAPRKPASTNAIRASLRGFFRYLVEADLLARNPSRLARRAICAPPPPRALRPAEEERLLGVLRGAEGFEARRDFTLIVLMLESGVRLSSALGLDVDDLDLDEGVLRLRSAKGGGEQRALVTGSSCKQLREFVGGRSGPVFASRTGRRLSARQAQRRFQMWREREDSTSKVTRPGARRRR